VTDNDILRRIPDDEPMLLRCEKCNRRFDQPLLGKYVACHCGGRTEIQLKHVVFQKAFIAGWRTSSRSPGFQAWFEMDSPEGRLQRVERSLDARLVKQDEQGAAISGARVWLQSLEERVQALEEHERRLAETLEPHDEMLPLGRIDLGGDPQTDMFEVVSVDHTSRIIRIRIPMDWTVAIDKRESFT
jgi:DNA-directed RNA polymerase subunit RPC12/RpoP